MWACYGCKHSYRELAVERPDPCPLCHTPLEPERR